MLQSLYVKNLALIEEIEIEFTPGLNILTGETGAGKSILLGSVSLALGGRYTKDILRDGAASGFVELNFLVESAGTVKKLNELDVWPEDGYLTLTRKITPGRSISKINGETVSMNTLKGAAELLLDIHGQHEHQSLLKKSHQMAIVDLFGGGRLQRAKAQTAVDWQIHHKAAQELEQELGRQRNVSKELDLLRFEADEIDSAALCSGEDEELEQRYQRMVHARKIEESAGSAYGLTAADEDGAAALTSRALNALQAGLKYDEVLQPLYEQLVDIDNLLADFNRDLADYAGSLETDEESLAQTEARLNEINRLKTKYGNTIEEILAYGEKQQSEIEKLEHYETYLSGLKEQEAAAAVQLQTSAEALSKLRRKAGDALAGQAEKHLQDLNFAATKFAIDLTPKETVGRDGRDEIEFMVSVNPGQPLRPLAQVASGGELSRIMLAIKTVMADQDEIGTLIFDEIDTGISGRTAQKVAEKMAVIARSHQVIAITHLPQITAMADTHYKIEKVIGNGQTRTEIKRLQEAESIDEISRILGGAEITESVRKSAAEMKQLADSIKHTSIEGV